MERYTYLTFAIAALISIMGCGEDVEEIESPPEVLSVTVAGAWELPSAEGWDIPSNASISVSFSKEMKPESVAAILNGIPVAATSQDNITFEFLPPEEGEYELSITGEDTYGRSLDPPYLPIEFEVVSPDTIPPHIVDEECEPQNGTDWVFAECVSYFVIAFSEPMAKVAVNRIDPDSLFEQELSPDRKFLTIELSKYTLPNEMHVKIELVGVDMAGNKLESGGYSFITAPRWSTGTIVMDLLFDVGAEHQTDLDSRRISNDLIQEFEDNGWELSQKAEVIVMDKGKNWIIAAEGEFAYFAIKAESRIRRDEERIYVYTITMLL